MILTRIRLLTLMAGLTGCFLFSSCSRSNKNDQAQLQIRLSDGPATGIREVWVDVQQVEVIINEGAPVMLGGIHPGVYNLLELNNGRDTLLADALVPAGKVSQLRLILGDNNFLVTDNGEKIPLKTPSAQQSGLKVQIHQDLTGGVLYRLVLDFDVARSVVQAGNSGNYILKPVLRIISFVPSGGDITGVVFPGSVRTAVIALHGADTVASTYSTVPGGNYFIKDVPPGNYILSFVPEDNSYKTAQLPAPVVLGKITRLDTLRLSH